MNSQLLLWSWNDADCSLVDNLIAKKGKISFFAIKLSTREQSASFRAEVYSCLRLPTCASCYILLWTSPQAWQNWTCMDRCMLYWWYVPPPYGLITTNAYHRTAPPRDFICSLSLGCPSERITFQYTGCLHTVSIDYHLNSMGVCTTMCVGVEQWL